MIIKGVFAILLFYVIGIGASQLIGGVIPGSVCGMLLLFAALCLGIVKPDNVRIVARALTQNMAVLFVPAGVGIMAQYDLIAQNWVGILTITIVCTLLVLLSTGGIAQYINNHFKNNNTNNGK
ncbi:MAG: CidA/LrgA family protein [Bacteroidaceae bacterium]|nr:CidA/LrgA family protein [Bacteroidaceae bacterium]